MQEYIPILISTVCALAILSLIAAMIFNEKFRDAMLGGSGDVKVVGILTVQGVAIVLLCALFLAGLVYPLSTTGGIGNNNLPETISAKKKIDSQATAPKAYSFSVGFNGANDLDVHLFRIEKGSRFNVQIRPYDTMSLVYPVEMEIWDQAGRMGCGYDNWNGYTQAAFNCEADPDRPDMAIVFRGRQDRKLGEFGVEVRLKLLKIDISYIGK